MECMYDSKSEPSALWVIMMCQCSFIICNKRTTLVGVPVMETVLVGTLRPGFACEP